MPLNVDFTYSVTQSGDLIEYNPDDGSETILQTGLQTYGDLAVMQNGTLLGFGFVGGIRGQIFTIDPDTGDETLLLDTGQAGGGGSGAASALGLDQFDNIYYSTNNNTEIARVLFDEATGTYGAPQTILTGQDSVFDIAFDGPNRLLYLHEVGGVQRLTLLELNDAGAILTTTNLGNTPDNDAFGLVQTRDGDLFLHEGSGEVHAVDISGGTAVFTEIDPVDPIPRNGGERIFGSAGFGICFARDVLISTPDGDVPVQELSPGDMVRTKDHGDQKLRWIGARRISATDRFAPIVFKPGAIGNHRELVLSQLHRVLITGWRAELLFGLPEVLAEAKSLINGDTIYLREGGEIEYFHLLFDQHELVFAEGVEAESLFLGDTVRGALNTDQLVEVGELFPELFVKGFEPMKIARPVLRSIDARVLASLN